MAPNGGPARWRNPGDSPQDMRKPMYDCGYESFLLGRDDVPPGLAPAGSGIETACLIKLLFAMPVAIAAEQWRAGPS